MARKRKDDDDLGFEDFEADFFRAGEQGALSWDEDPVRAEPEVFFPEPEPVPGEEPAAEAERDAVAGPAEPEPAAAAPTVAEPGPAEAPSTVPEPAEAAPTVPEPSEVAPTVPEPEPAEGAPPAAADEPLSEEVEPLPAEAIAEGVEPYRPRIDLSAFAPGAPGVAGEEPGTPPEAADAPGPASVEVRTAPGGADGSWWSEAELLVAEASRREGAERALLLARAARIHRVRLGDPTAAEPLARAAWETGVRAPEVAAEYTAVLTANARWEELVEVLRDRAALTERPEEAAELLRDAAVFLRTRLHRPEDAVAALRQALERDPTDHLSLEALRGLYQQLERWEELADVLEREAELLRDARSGVLAYRRGAILLDRLGRREEAKASFAAAREADPAQASAWLALQALLEEDEAWEDLAALLEARAGVLGPEDAWLLHLLAGDLRRARVLDLEGALVSYRRALEAGAGQEAHHRIQVVLKGLGRWDELAASLEEEAAGLEGTARAHALLALAEVAEQRLGDLDRALAAYREAASDGGALVAVEGAVRILERKQAWRELAAFLQERHQAASDPSVRVLLALRLGELHEERLGDLDRAAEWFERVLSVQPGYVPALDALERVDRARGAWEHLLRLYEQRAIQAEEPESTARFLALAGSVAEQHLDDPDRALDYHRRALEQAPAFPDALHPLVHLLEARQAWGEVVGVLERAAAASDPPRSTAWLYRAARLALVREEDVERAADLLRRTLATSPGFEPARRLLEDVLAQGGHWDEVQELRLAAIDRVDDPRDRAWALLAAAQLASRVAPRVLRDLLARILRDDPAHPGGNVLLECDLLATGEDEALANLYRQAMERAEDPAARARLGSLVAVLSRSVGRPADAVQAAADVLALDDAPSRPLRVLAGLLEMLQVPEEALRAVRAAGDLREVARLAELVQGDPARALEAWREADAGNPGDPTVLWALERLEQRLGHHRELALVHERLAEASEGSVRQAHAGLAGRLYEQLGDEKAAVRAWRMALEAAPGPGRSFEHLRTLLVRAGDADGLLQAHEAVGSGDGLDLVEDLLDAGHPEPAAERLGDRDDLPALLLARRVHRAREAWTELAETLRRLAGSLDDDDSRQAAERELRDLLAGPLAGTDEAWETYRRLHEQRPEDREVLEALAAMARQRGEPGLAVQYLGSLVATASHPREAASLERTIAEILLEQDDDGGAQAALFRALDHHPADLDTLARLRALAERREDWRAVVRVLAREADLLEGAEQVQRFAEIARLWEERIQDAAVAADAWRNVLGHDPAHREALERLVALTEAAGDWLGFVEAARALVDQLEGADRTALLRRIGVASLDHLRREEDAIRFLEAASTGPHPDLEAARRLEQLRSARGEWNEVVDALRRQARALPSEDAVAPLLRAARIMVETLHNRAEAAGIYEEVLAQDPSNLEAIKFLAEVRFEEGRMDEAVALFERLEGFADRWDLEDFDERIELSLYHFNHARALDALGRRDEMLARLDAALELNPTHLPSLRLIGPLLIRARRWKDAERVYRQLLQLTGGAGDAAELADTYTRLGEVEWALGKPAKARKRFNKALELRPNHIPALEGIGQVLYAAGEWSSLLNVFNNVIFHARDARQVIRAYLVKGHVLDTRMGLWEKAAQHYRKTLTFDDRQPEALLRLGELALRRKDWTEAAGLLERALSASRLEDDLAALLHLGRAVALAACGDGEASRSELERARNLDVALGEALADVDAADPAALSEVLGNRLHNRLP